MRIKFVFPPAFDEAKLSMLPYGMCVLAGYLKQLGFDVEQEDLMIKLRRINVPKNIFRREFNMSLITNTERVYNYLFNSVNDKELDSFSKKLGELGKFRNYDIIGISVHSLFQFPFALLLAKYVKKTYSPLIIMGGPFITLRGAEFIKKATFIDFMVQGEGEIPIRRLLEADIYKKDLSFNAIPGLIYCKNGEVFVNERIYLPIEEMSIPDFNGLDIDLYKYAINGKPEAIFTYQFTKGCKGRCCFCTHHIVSDILQTKSSKKIIRELKEICSAYNAKYFYICDSAINSNYEELKEICDAIKNAGLHISWGSLGRLDNITDELAKKLKESGCKFLRFGFESGSDRILKIMGKAHTTETAMSSVKNMHKYHIKTLGSFMAGFIGETERDIAATGDFIKKVSPFVFDLECGICVIDPKSDMQLNPEDYGIKNLKPRNDHFIPCEIAPRLTLKFDEVNGLEWRRKIIQQVTAMEECNRIIYSLVTKKRSMKILARWMPFFIHSFLEKNKYRKRLISFLYTLLMNKDYYYTYSSYYRY